MNCTQCGKLLPEANSPFCPFCGGTQSGDATNPSANQENVGQPVPMQTVGEQLEAAQPAPTGGFPPATAGSGTPFDPTLPQQAEKKRLPAWAIALIAGGIALALAICCCIAMVGFFANEIGEEIERELERIEAELEQGSGIDPIVLPGNDDNSNLTDDPIVNVDTESAALIQAFIDDSFDMLMASSEPLLATMGRGASVEFAAADGELIYIYTYGDFPSEGLIEILEVVLDASAGLYEMLAREFAHEIGLDELTVTIRYYDSDGNFLIAESFESR